ncbi:hypothetical protein [Nocardioides sp. CER19]|uniref:hypothetical protein n=1 Tax=Nocardioides sp. CER19 TaxID=3038538 RepID=UPI0024493C6B|nr:hypothetical protein [Nocardioides sp. CER19]MDH2416258.1 hypothetical protein [Nocardioides sp. CER19]
MTLTRETPPARPLPAYAPPDGRAWSIAAWVAVLVATATHLWVAHTAFVKGFPTFSYDEIDTLMAGRAALGIPTPHIDGSGYFPLSSILVSPVWWLTSDPFTFYRVATAVGVVTALVTIWPLARIATRFGLTTSQAVTVGAVVMAIPARSVQAEYTLAEKPLFLLLTLSVLAAVRLGERPTAVRAVLFGVLVALTYFTHARMLVFVAAAALWLLLFAFRRWQAALVGLVTLLPLAWVVHRVALHVNGLVDPSGFDQGQHMFDNLRAGNADMLLRAGLGQAWEQLVSGFGLTAVGVVVGLVLVRRELRGRSPGVACLVVLTFVALFAGSVIAWGSADQLYATTWRRLDAWIYGRYVDPAADLLVLLALCAVVRGVSRLTLVAAWCVALVIAVPTLLWLAPKAPTGAFITPAHIPGAMAWWWALPTHTVVPGSVPSLTNDNRFWLLATLTALVPLAVLAVGRLRVQRAATLTAALVTGLVLSLAGAGTVFADQANGRYQETHQVISPLVRQLRSILADHPGTTVGYQQACPKPVWQAGGRRNRFTWQLLPTVVSGTTKGVDIAIACGAAGDSLPPGGVLLEQSAFGVIYAWVMPGALQDELRDEGLLTTPS